jgi:hypothetical protein
MIHLSRVACGSKRQRLITRHSQVDFYKKLPLRSHVRFGTARFANGGLTLSAYALVRN